MHNHSNDLKKLNTISTKPASKGKPFLLHSIRDIAPGEQILISYNRCHRCWPDKTYRDCVSYSHYGTSHIFDIFGFVEFFPQMWTFEMDVGPEGEEERDTLVVCLEEPTGGGDLKVTFGDNYTPARKRDEERPTIENIYFLGDQLARLRALEGSAREDEALRETMPRHEWDTAWQYHGALMTAISASILASDFAEVGYDSGEDSEYESRDDHYSSGDDSGDGSGDDSDDGSGDDSDDGSGDDSDDGSGDESGDDGGRDEL